MRDPMRTQAIPIPPEAVWAALPPALRRRIAAQMAAILAEETPHEVRTGHARASRAALAVVYVRQSTPAQVVSNQESLRLQYALTGRARDLGWRAADIDVIDADLGQSGASLMGRDGFKDLAARVGLGEIGIVLSIDVTRLARNCSPFPYPQVLAASFPAAEPATRSARREKLRHVTMVPGGASCRRAR